MTHPSFITATFLASAAIAEAEAAADRLVDTMRRIHGGQWAALINHERGVVIVSEKSGYASIRPKSEDL